MLIWTALAPAAVIRFASRSVSWSPSMTAIGTVEVADGALEQGCLARAGRAGQVERENIAFGQVSAVVLGEFVILGQDLLFERDGLGVVVAVFVFVAVLMGRRGASGLPQPQVAHMGHFTSMERICS